MAAAATNAAAAAAVHTPRSLNELVTSTNFEHARRALAPFYRLRREAADAVIPEPVAQRYGTSGARQHVIQVTDRLLPGRQTCWNPQRGQKPQNFTASAANAAPRPHHALDPLLNGKLRCDFCEAETSTAEDVGFGRYRNARAVSASNLFKCAAPYHGVVILTGDGGDGDNGRPSTTHDPLAFRRADVAALLDCARGWFALAAAAESDAPLHPFLLWNALPRSGASQYHAHAQTTLTRDPVPEQASLWRAERAFAEAAAGKGPGAGGSSSSRCYYTSLLRAKAAAGLLRVVTATAEPSGGNGSSSDSLSSSSASLASLSARVAAEDEESPPAVAYVYASLAPVKDAELVVVVPPANAADASTTTTNLHALNNPALARALHAALRAVVDGVGGGSGAFNAAVHNLQVVEGREADQFREYDDEQWPPLWPPPGAAGGDDDGAAALFAGAGGGSRPLVARVVSRGVPSAVASDFGALEVLGGASIGHTDPYELLRLFDAALEAANREEEEQDEGRRLR
jgi:hypothetical protein